MLNLLLQKYNIKFSLVIYPWPKQIYDKNMLNYWPDEWVPSFKYHCVPSLFMRFFKEPSIPLNAKIILFHGLPNPPEAIQGISGKWYRYIKPTPWIEDYWNE